MHKHLFLLIAFTFFIGYFLCKSQQKIADRKIERLSTRNFQMKKFAVDVAARKTGPLSTSSSSGSAACSNCVHCTTGISTDSLTMLDPSTAIFCLNDTSMVLKAYYSCDGV